ncbi:phosphotriesterase [Demequina sp. NBRC 110056]|uniref:phosphotriesterase family protein n=1 Tax=Demequina sp. NBRC 110056 TaxID=1570345 RepID=UPI000A039EAC|nr:hypothetical protein [Demequina sp. NBRC 110056]
MGTVATYSGDTHAADLGVTLMHEHLFVRQPELDGVLPDPEWDAQGAVERAVELLKRLFAHGVRTLVDLTVPGIGRDATLVGEVARRSPVAIVASTGWYTTTVLPPALQAQGPGRLVDGPDLLSALFVADLTRGIAGTEVRAGMIKVASAGSGITEDVRRVFAAAAHAHAETGAPITTHSDPLAGGGPDQQDLLESLGVDLTRVVIGHAGDGSDLTLLRRIADRGSFLGFDRFGMEHTAPDARRVDNLVRLIELGYADRVVLSHDAAVHSRVTPPSWRATHTPHWHMEHLHRTILPALRERGVSEGTLATMMIDNPRRILAGH